MRRRSWGYNNRAGFGSLGYQIETTGGISVLYTWNKDEHVYKVAKSIRPQRNNCNSLLWRCKANQNRTSIRGRVLLRWIQANAEQIRKSRREGRCLYWSYNPSTKQFYTNCLFWWYDFPAWASFFCSSLDQEWPRWNTSGNSLPTLGWRNRQPLQDCHSCWLVRTHGRMFMSAYYPWGCIRYNHISFSTVLSIVLWLMEVKQR